MLRRVKLHLVASEQLSDKDSVWFLCATNIQRARFARSCAQPACALFLLMRRWSQGGETRVCQHMWYYKPLVIVPWYLHWHEFSISVYMIHLAAVELVQH